MKSPDESVLAAAMIPRSPETGEPSLWQRELAAGFKHPRQLLEFLQLDNLFDESMVSAAEEFRTKVPISFALRMQPGDAGDPLLRQVLPSAEELRTVEGFTSDPVGDIAAQRGPALLQKYSGRALMITTGSCAVHCRYCFRREFPYYKHNIKQQYYSELFDLIHKDSSIEEVILSGGDPLMLSDERLESLIYDIRGISHVKRIRIHTRLPVVLPSRVTIRLRSLFVSTQPVVVLHINHPQEIDEDVRKSLSSLADTGATLLNQSVLLHGVNDNAETLVELSTRCFDARVLPYYLHMLDPVAGAAHFNVPQARAKELEEQMRARLPGYLVPRLVREIPGAVAKIPV